MRLAIISDTHDNLVTLEKAVKWMNENGVQEIIHCGDICSPYTLGELSKMFAGKIHVVFGNVDPVIEFQQSFSLKNPKAQSEPKLYYGIESNVFTMRQQKTADELPNVILCGEIGELKIDNTAIAFVHQPKIAKELALSGKYDLVFYGHTHKPWEEKIKNSLLTEQKIFPKNNCRLINPGNLSGLLYRATFAVYDTTTDELELKILEKL